MKSLLNVISKKGKGREQEVQGVIVMKEKGEFVFNYNTTIDPRPEDIELLKLFRNRFVNELEQLNNALNNITL